MPTESDRDELARIIYEGARPMGTWERAEIVTRFECTLEADAVLKAGYRFVGADQVVVDRETFSELLAVQDRMTEATS